MIVWPEVNLYDPIKTDTNLAQIDFEDFKNEDLAQALAFQDEPSSLEMSVCQSQTLFNSMRDSVSSLVDSFDGVQPGCLKLDKTDNGIDKARTTSSPVQRFCCQLPQLEFLLFSHAQVRLFRTGGYFSKVASVSVHAATIDSPMVDTMRYFASTVEDRDSLLVLLPAVVRSRLNEGRQNCLPLPKSVSDNTLAHTGNEGKFYATAARSTDDVLYEGGHITDDEGNAADDSGLGSDSNKQGRRDNTGQESWTARLSRRASGSCSSRFSVSEVSHSSASRRSLDSLSRRCLIDTLHSTVTSVGQLCDDRSAMTSTCPQTEVRLKHLLLSVICPTIHALMSEGLKTEVHTSFGQLRPTAWNVVEALVRATSGGASAGPVASSILGPSASGSGPGVSHDLLSGSLPDLVMLLNTHSRHLIANRPDGGACSDVDLAKFAGFLCGLLDMCHLHTWFSSLRWSIETLTRFYDDTAFTCALTKDSRLMFDEFLMSLMQLTTSLANLVVNEGRFLRMIFRRAQSTSSCSDLSSDSRAAPTTRRTRVDQRRVKQGQDYGLTTSGGASIVSRSQSQGTLASVVRRTTLHPAVGGDSNHLPNRASLVAKDGVQRKALFDRPASSRIPRPISLPSRRLSLASTGFQMRNATTPTAVAAAQRYEAHVSSVKFRPTVTPRRTPASLHIVNADSFRPIHTATDVQLGLGKASIVDDQASPRVRDTIRLFDAANSGPKPGLSSQGSRGKAIMHTARTVASHHSPKSSVKATYI